MTPNDAALLSDSALDDACEQAYVAAAQNPSIQTVSDCTIIEQEILTRLGGVTGFIGGVFGHTSFPKYNKYGRFKQVDVAQTAVKESAVNLASNVTHSNFAKYVGIGAGVLVGLFILSKVA